MKLIFLLIQFTLINCFAKVDYTDVLLNAYSKVTSKQCRCGIEALKNRIVGGKETKPFRFPWMVAILLREDVICGGAIISDMFIITAAHCFNHLRRDELKIYINVHNLNEVSKGDILNISEVYIHPQYNPTQSSFNFDLALIKLSVKLNFKTGHIRPVCLPFYPLENGSRLMIAGWGRTREDQMASDVLNLIEFLPKVKKSTCKQLYELFAHVRLSHYHICAGNHSMDTSFGDSGSPLMQKWTGKVFIIGTVAFGYVQDAQDYSQRLPGVYTKVRPFLTWILTKTIAQKSIFCSF